jgi:hypothetical protein
MSNNWIGKPASDISNRITQIGAQLERARSGEITLSEDIQDSLSEELVELAEAARKATDCTSRNADVGWMRENIETCKTYLNSESYAYWKSAVETDFSGPNPCGTTTIATISKSLQKLFKFLKSVKKYYNNFVQPALNTITGLQETLQNATELIAGVMKILIQRVRNFIIQKVKNLLTDALTQLLPQIGKTIQNAIVKQIIDTIFCKFGEIIDGLVNLVSSFLTELIGGMINAPFCAARQFTNSLLNNVANRLDRALKPIFDQINSIVKGVGSIAGSVFQAIDFILGFENFLCSSGPECPETKSFAAAIWGGPQEEAADKFKNFLDGLNLSSGETSDLLNQFDRWVGDFPIFKGDGAAISPFVSTLGDQLDSQCSNGVYRCGPPKVEIFGGGGVGAAGKAIVNQLGQVVGVNLTYPGTGYESPPFVTFMDNCGIGANASGYAILDEDDNDLDSINYDLVTLNEIGEEDINGFYGGNDTNIDSGTRGDCVYSGKVYHEFDNFSNKHLVSEISSEINVDFKGKDCPDQVDVTFAKDQKHYAIKFAVPYESDDYKIDFTKVSNLSANVKKNANGDIILGDSTEEAVFNLVRNSNNTNYIYFDAPGLPRITLGPDSGEYKVEMYKNVSYTVTSSSLTKIVKDQKPKVRKKVRFRVTRDASINNRITFTGGGESFTIKDVPKSGTTVYEFDMLTNTQYKITTSAHSIKKFSNRKFGIEDWTDKDYDDLLVTCSTGKINSNLTWSLEYTKKTDTGKTREGAADVAVLSTSKLVTEDIRGLQSNRDFNDLVVTTKSGIFTEEGEARFRIQSDNSGIERTYQVAGIRNKTRYGFDVWFGVQRRDRPVGTIYSTYVREFEFKTYGVREGCSRGKKIKKIIMVNSGNDYLPGPNGRDEFGNILDGLDDSNLIATNTEEYVGCLTEIEVISTGIGYSPDDEISIEPDLPGLDVRVQMTEMGQIVAMIIVNGYCGLTEVPTITINSRNGSGAEFRPIIDYIATNRFTGDLQGEVVKVIDCVYK